jgi:hypothetical protein
MFIFVSNFSVHHDVQLDEKSFKQFLYIIIINKSDELKTNSTYLIHPYRNFIISVKLYTESFIHPH